MNNAGLVLVLGGIPFVGDYNRLPAELEEQVSRITSCNSWWSRMSRPRHVVRGPGETQRNVTRHDRQAPSRKECRNATPRLTLEQIKQRRQIPEFVIRCRYSGAQLKPPAIDPRDGEPYWFPPHEVGELGLPGVEYFGGLAA